MTKPPKKIWITPPDARLIGWTSSEENVMPQDTPYIRADLVDELYQALEITAELVEALGHTAKKARIVLAMIKEKV